MSTAETSDWPHGYGLCYCGCGERTPLARRTYTGKGQKKGEPMRWVDVAHANGGVGLNTTATCAHCDQPLPPPRIVCGDCKRAKNRAYEARYRASPKGQATTAKMAATRQLTPEQRARHAENARRRLAKPGVAEAKRAREREQYATDAEYREARRTYQRGRPGGKPGKSSDAQRKARQRVADALRRNKLVKPQACEGCSRTFSSRRLHAHHADYSKPLEVQWLCVDCHMVKHRKFA